MVLFINIHGACVKVGDLVWVYRNAHPSQEKFIGMITEIEEVKNRCSVFVTFFDGHWGVYHPSQINLIPKEGDQ